MSELVAKGVTQSVDRRGALHFWGEVENVGTATHRWVRVRIDLLDDAGLEVAHASDILGLEWALPGTRVPFTLEFESIPRPWCTYRLLVEGQPHDYEDGSVPQPHIELVAERLHLRTMGHSGLACTVVGLLRNAGPEPASRVKVAGTLYDADDRVVSVLSPYVVPERSFAPGEQLAFELKFYATSGDVAGYRVQVQGRRH